VSIADSGDLGADGAVPGAPGAADTLEVVLLLTRRRVIDQARILPPPPTLVEVDA
jgi:hypothetical protein